MRQRTVDTSHEIRTILTDPNWRVRPDGQEIPAGLQGSLAGDVFSAFARVTDGVKHQDRKSLVISEIAGLNLEAIPETTTEIVRSLDPVTPCELQYLVPGMVIGHLLGVPKAAQRALVEQVRALVVGSRAHATPAEFTAAIAAMEHAVPTVAATLDPANEGQMDTIAARISMLFQASDAGAALIGNALLTLSAAPADSRADASGIVRDSMRARVPVRSTTRFRDSDSVVLNLENAHLQHPDADWTFGFGPHACPGRALAVDLAVACVTAVVEVRPFDPAAISSSGWEDLPNVWIPTLFLERGGEK